jgi:hypothetical protein
LIILGIIVLKKQRKKLWKKHFIMLTIMFAIINNIIATKAHNQILSKNPTPLKSPEKKEFMLWPAPPDTMTLISWKVYTTNL